MSGRSGGNLRRRFINVISGIVSLFLVLCIILGLIIVVPLTWAKDKLCSYTHTKIFCNGIIDVQNVQVGLDTLNVGLSDGYSAFDIRDPNGSDKENAVKAMQSGNIDQAINDWNQAIHITTDDAESMIYKEDARVQASKIPFVTIVVVTTLSQTPDDSSTSIDVARDDLRGAYMAQRDFNTQHTDLQLRVIIANIGIKAKNYLDQTENVVLQRIIRLANTDSTFVGVVGFPFSNAAKIAIPVLSAAHIPIISPSASSTSLTNISRYFFRVVPSDADQGRDAAQFMSQVLNVHRIAVFSDSSDPYSSSLGESVRTSFQQLGGAYSVIPEQFTLHSADSLDPALKNLSTQQQPAEMIFIAGYGDDVNNLKTKLALIGSSFPIMGGDASYELGGYQQSPANYGNFYFTAFTYPDTWSVLCSAGTSCAGEIPSAANLKIYSQLFDPNGQHPGSYGYDRMGPHVLLTYDATTVLVQAAYSIVSNGGSVSLDAVRDALQISTLQGASGQIAFSGSDPVNKAVYMLCVDSKHHTQLVHVYGQFAQGTKPYSLDVNYIKYQLCA